MKTRTGKAFLNMSTSLAYQIVAVICGLITPRLILRAFGSTYNGVVASAAQFLSMINILTLGITASTRVSLYKPLANNDTLAISRLMKALKKYMLKVSMCIIAYVAVLCVVYPFISNNDLTYLQNTALIAIVGIGTFADYFFGISNITLLQASQASYVNNITSIIKTVLNTVCVALLINFGCSVYIVKLGSAIVFLITPAVLSLYIKKKYSLTNKCEPDSTGIKGRKAVAFHSISNLIHNNTDLVVLTFFMDAKEMSVYNVYYLVVGNVKSMMSVITSGMEAAFGDMWAKGEIETLNKNFRTFEYMLFTFTSVVFSCMGVLILPFIRVYTLGVDDINYIIPSLAILITLAEGMYCIRQPYLTLVYATGKFEETKIGAVIEAVINIVLSVVLVSFMGIGGVIVGTLVANAFRTLQFSYFSSKHILKRSYGEVVRRFIYLLACCTITVTLSLLIDSAMTFEASWLGWLSEAVIVFALTCAVNLIMSILFYRKNLTDLLKTGLRVFKK